MGAGSGEASPTDRRGSQGPRPARVPRPLALSVEVWKCVGGGFNAVATPLSPRFDGLPSSPSACHECPPPVGLRSGAGPSSYRRPESGGAESCGSRGRRCAAHLISDGRRFFPAPSQTRDFDPTSWRPRADGLGVGVALGPLAVLRPRVAAAVVADAPSAGAASVGPGRTGVGGGCGRPGRLSVSLRGPRPLGRLRPAPAHVPRAALPAGR